MNRIEEMIKEMCPDGVRRVRLGDVCEVCRGKRVVRKELADTGVIPVFQNSLKPLGYYDKSNYPSNTPYIISAGGAGDVGFSVLPFWAADDCFVILSSNLLLSNFIYFILKTKEIYFKSQIRGGAIKRLPKDIVVDLQIPLPPLPIQQEIVKILDSFTALQQNLEDELKLRQKQYEHYREKLLTFEDGECEWKKISEISNAVYAGATPSTKNKEYWENGDIRWMSSGEVHQGQVFEVEGRITQLGYDKCSTKMVPVNSIVIALAGQGKTRGTVAITRVELCTNQSICAVVPNNEIVKSDYLYYYLKGQYMNLRQVSSGDGTRGGLNLKMINNYEVPVPSLNNQLQITQTLDHFESLISNIKTEIELRKKQYEYYREKLLTF